MEFITFVSQVGEALFVRLIEVGLTAIQLDECSG
jgi:hypothetical protein